MRKLRVARLIAILSVACCSFAAQAQDWSGFYGGGDGGGRRSHLKMRGNEHVVQITNLFVAGDGLVVVPGTTVPFSGSRSKTSAFGGGFLGYQRQFDHLVLGMEGEISLGGRSGSGTSTHTLPNTALTPATTVTIGRSIDSGLDWSLRGRVGYAAGHSLFYGTAGVAGARARMKAHDTFFDPGGPAFPGPIGPLVPGNFGPYGPTVTDARSRASTIGWTVGGGVEQLVMRHLSIGLEYRHTDLGAKTFRFASSTPVNTGSTIVVNNNSPPPAGGIPSATHTSIRWDALSFRIAWHFGG